MNYKFLLSKLKLMGNYPYELPNSNIVLTSDTSAEVDEFSIITNEISRVNINLDFTETLLSNEDTVIITNNHNGIFYCVLMLKNNDSIKILRVFGSIFCFVNDDFIHIVARGRRNYCNLYLLDKSNFNLVKKFEGIDRRRVPKYKWGSSQRLGLRKVGFTSYVE